MVEEFSTVSVCLAFSAFYELIEWWAAELIGEDAEAFLERKDTLGIPSPTWLLLCWGDLPPTDDCQDSRQAAQTIALLRKFLFTLIHGHGLNERYWVEDTLWDKANLHPV